MPGDADLDGRRMKSIFDLGTWRPRGRGPPRSEPDGDTARSVATSVTLTGSAAVRAPPRIETETRTHRSLVSSTTQKGRRGKRVRRAGPRAGYRIPSTSCLYLDASGRAASSAARWSSATNSKAP